MLVLPCIHRIDLPEVLEPHMVRDPGELSLHLMVD